MGAAVTTLEPWGLCATSSADNCRRTQLSRQDSCIWHSSARLGVVTREYCRFRDADVVVLHTRCWISLRHCGACSGIRIARPMGCEPDVAICTGCVRPQWNWTTLPEETENSSSRGMAGACKKTVRSTVLLSGKHADTSELDISRMQVNKCCSIAFSLDGCSSMDAGPEVVGALVESMTPIW